LAGDGHYCRRYGIITLSTESFSLKEVEKLRDILLKYGIDSSLITRDAAKEQYIIRMPKREVEKLQNLVKPHMPP